MTAQHVEVLIYNGLKKSMHSTPELPSDDSKVQLLEGDAPVNTACWRGYVGTWEIKNKKLFLNEISGKFKIKRSKPLFADWFTGRLIIPSGELLQYIHGGFGGKHEEEELITIVGGRVIKVEYKDNCKPTDLSYHLKQQTNKLLTAAINDAESVFTNPNALSPEQSLIIIQFKFDELIEKHIGKLALHLHSSRVPISINISKSGSKLDEDTEVSSIIVSLQDVWAKEICDFLGVEFVDPLETLPCLKGNWLSFGTYKSQLQIPPKIDFGDDINF